MKTIKIIAAAILGLAANAGVALEIGFLDPRWTLGAATLGDLGRAPLAALESGLELWPAPSPAAPGELGGP